MAQFSYLEIICDTSKIGDGFRELLNTIVLSADVHLAVDAVDLWVETQQDAECSWKVIGQTRLADWTNPFEAAIDDKLKRHIFL